MMSGFDAREPNFFGDWAQDSNGVWQVQSPERRNEIRSGTVESLLSEEVFLCGPAGRLQGLARIGGGRA